MKTSVRPKQPDYPVLRSAGLGLALLALAMLAWPLIGQAQTAPPAAGQGAAPTQQTTANAARKDDVIRELIGLTDAEQLEAIFSRQFIDRVANAVALFRPDLDPQTMRVIRQEATSVIRERIESGDALYSVLYPVYEKHFNIFELNQLVEFYQSPVGQKLVRVSPELLTESLALGREWGLSLVPEIMDRVQSRLNTTN
ncbi:hypothetical protein SADO_10619 [Salinisphaera dokdonensis CL-ES53]|uniref:DUF2059 domain-containing protein n=1 Tax=Salinisphaera dokdonensis CL-ES53 TaxID=1304272 RepID=A0ABV2B1F2_9GAMM